MNEMRDLKFVETLSITFEKTSQDGTINKRAYFNNAPKTVINTGDLEEDLMFSSQEIQNKIATWISEGSCWIIKSVNGQWINIDQYNPLKGSSYIQLPSELKNSAKGLINLKIKIINVSDGAISEIKTHKDFKTEKQHIEKLDYIDIEFPVSVKNRHSQSVSKEKVEHEMNILLRTEDENKHYVLIKNFNRFMYHTTKHQHRRHFCIYCSH